MSRDDRILVAVVSTRPWQMFDAGLKGEEYRADKPGKDGWARKLLADGIVSALDRDPEWYRTTFHAEAEIPLDWFQHYHTLRLPLGYRSDRPILDIPIIGTRWALPNPAWTCGIIAPARCFCIAVDVANRRRIA